MGFISRTAEKLKLTGKIRVHLLTEEAKIEEIRVGILSLGDQVGVERTAEVHVLSGVGEEMCGCRGAGELDAGGRGDADAAGAARALLTEDHCAVLVHEPRIIVRR